MEKLTFSKPSRLCADTGPSLWKTWYTFLSHNKVSILVLDFDLDKKISAKYIEKRSFLDGVQVLLRPGPALRIALLE